jgi:3-oxoacyl-[acyl-carrier-protein] synthase-1
MAIEPAYISAFTLSSALGFGNEAAVGSIKSTKGGLRELSTKPSGSTWFGYAEPPPNLELPSKLAPYDNVASRLIQGALAQDGFIAEVEKAKARFGKHRVGCFLGTITSSVCRLEELYKDNAKEPGSGHIVLDYHGSINATIQFTRKYLDITGPYATISTACSSSAKVFATAYRYLQAGLCDAVVVAGVEPLCEILVYGFRSLGVLSANPCKPWDANRDGISIGAAAGFALLTREPTGPDNFILKGFGESSDAYHMTSPHPQGLGVEACMREALKSAGLNASDIDYVNAHGSGTPMNDITEDGAICRVLGEETLVSSTKGWTGHTQGAAGITEAIIVMLSMRESLVPATLNTTQIDPATKCNLVLENRPHTIRYALTNSMGFGGNNATLILGAPQ